MASHHKAFFVERTDFALRIARVVRGSENDIIEDVRAATVNSPAEAREFIYDFTQEKVGNLVRAYCAIYPSGRILRHVYLKDGPQSMDTEAMHAAVAQQLEIDLNSTRIVVLNCDDGFPFVPKRLQKNFVVCGAPREQLREAQDFFVEAGIYPLRMEMGSVATMGLLLKSLRLQKIEDPVLMLEIGYESSQVLIVSGSKVESAKPLPLGINSMVAGVRKELGLKDEESARRLFYSDSFDFREMGSRLIERILRDLQSMTGFYEVQTGQSISRMICGLLPAKLAWLNNTFADSLGMSRLDIDLPGLLAASGLALPEDNGSLQLETPHGLLSLMVKQEVQE